MPKLTDTHLIILANAAKRDDRSVLPLPKKMKLNSDTTTAAIKTLIAKKLIAEQPAGSVKSGDGGDGAPVMLIVTDAGLEAIKVERASEPKTPARSNRKRSQRRTEMTATSVVIKRGERRKAGGNAKASAGATRPDTKQAKLIDLLKRPGGASIAEMVKATGWQAHSVRGVMSGTLKKKLGLVIQNEAQPNSGRVYRITDRG